MAEFRRASVVAAGGVAIRLLPLVGGSLVLAWLLSKVQPANGQQADWLWLAMVAGAVLIAGAVMLVFRLGLAFAFTTSAPPPAASVADGTIRDRLALLVLGVGTAAIVVLSIGVIIAFTVLAYRDPELEKRFDSLLMSVFTAVLPVFATWVGTVIAFYFSNESFRQAAQSAREAAGALQPGPRVAERMIPYKNIAKIEADPATVLSLPMGEITKQFNDAITRVLIFTPARLPRYIVRKTRLPQTWVGAKDPQNPTLNDYLTLNGNANLEDAKLFAWAAESDTVDAGRAAILKAKSKDLFVTLTGTQSEAVLGWVPDDKLT